MPVGKHIFNFGKPLAEVPPNYQTHLRETAQKGWGYFLRGMRIWESLEADQAFAQRNLNPFFLMMEVGDKEGHTGEVKWQEGSSLVEVFWFTHGSRCFSR